MVDEQTHFLSITNEGQVDDLRLLDYMEQAFQSIYQTSGPEGLESVIHRPNITRREAAFLRKVQDRLPTHEKVEVLALLSSMFSATKGDDKFPAYGKIAAILKAHHIDASEWTQ